MDLEQIVKETVAKIVAEKELTAAEEKKREEIVKAMKKDFKGPAPAMYAIATDKAKKLAEDGIDEAVPTDERFVHYPANNNVLDTVKYKLSSLDQSILSNDYVFKHDTNVNDEGDVVVRMYAKPRFVPKNSRLAENEDHEVSMAQRSLDSIIRAAMELKAKIGDQEIDIPAWIQDHITNSENYIDQASQGYHEYENGGEHGEMDEANLGHNESSSIEQEGRFWIVTYKTMDGTKEKSFESEDEARAFYNTLDEAFKPKSSFDDYSVGDNVTIAGKKAKITAMEMDDETGERRARVKFEDGSVEKVNIDSLNETQELDEYIVRRWQHYAGIK
jgi:hypothetical protein